jgi:hypothetical protein
MSNMLHKGGLPELVSEIGFSVVKYFEGTVSSTATTIDLDPPCKRVVIRNTNTTNPLYVRVDGQVATASVGMLPGDNIKVAGLGIFIMDFDTVHAVSLITASGTVFVEGILGYKGYL